MKLEEEKYKLLVKKNISEMVRTFQESVGKLS